MSVHQFGLTDFQAVAAGAAVLASGGGGSYQDALYILQQVASSGWSGTVTVQPYDGSSSACVLAMMGSPDAAGELSLEAVSQAMSNTTQVLQAATGETLQCLIPVEIGPINSLAPLIAAAQSQGNLWVVNGDGAGRAVPELPQTTYAGSTTLPPSPAALASDAAVPAQVESAVLQASTATKVESLAGGVVSAFGGYSGLAMWPSTAANGHGLSGSYIADTLVQTRDLGLLLLAATQPLSTTQVAEAIALLTQRSTDVLAQNFYITDVTQATSSASLDCGVIRLDNTPHPDHSTDTRYLYNMNENLIMYNTATAVPDAVAPDSICYYSEGTGQGFSNASDDLALYFDATTGQSTGVAVSVIRVRTAPALYQAPGVLASFASLLRGIGYAGALPSA